MSCKQSFILLFLFGAVSFYVPVESVLCRNTSITANFSDPEIRHEVIGDVIARFFRSPNAPRRSQLGDEVVDYILNLYNETDSPRLKAQLQAFGRVLPVLILLASGKGDLCTLAKGINATAQYVRNNNNRAILPIIDTISPTIEGGCKSLTEWILRDMGCKKLPEIPCYQGPTCPDAGYVYDINDILGSYGQYIPCRFKNYIIELYESARHEDKTLAAFLTVSLTSLSVSVSNVFAIQNIFEITNIIIDPKEKICCCKARRTRLLDICEGLGDTNVDPIRVLFTTECPPEAAYQK